MMKKYLFFFIFCVWGVLSGADSRGTVLFRDDFTTHQTFAENWKPEHSHTQKCKTENGMLTVTGGGELKLRRDLPENFIAEYQVVFDGKNNGSAGFVVDGKYFRVLSSGVALGWMGAKIPDFEYGTPVTLTLIRTLSANSAEYVFLANGTLMKRELTQAPLSVRNQQLQKESADKFAVEGAGGGIESEMNDLLAEAPEKSSPEPLTMSVHNVSVSKFRLLLPIREDQSPNTVANSSFEYTDVDGMPFYFVQRPDTWDIVGQKISFERYLSKIRSIDTTEKVHGKQSLRVTYEEGMIRFPHIWFRGAGMIPGPMVFSVDLKASEDRYPVTISLGNSKKDILVGKEWKRYFVKNPEIEREKGDSGIGISSRKYGTLWMDAIQVESGNAATEYRPSAQDAYLFAEKKRIVRPPALDVPKLPVGVVPGADFDKWTGNAVMTDRFVPSVSVGNVFFACDDETLYVGIRSPLANARFFLLPAGNGNFETLSGSLETAAFPGRSVSLKQNGKTTDYLFKIPFYSVAGERLKNDWIVNVGLIGRIPSERAALSANGVFQSVDSSPFLRFSPDLLRPYRISVEGDRAEKNGKTYLGIRIGNRTGKEVKGNLEIVSSGRMVPVFLKPGETVLNLQEPSIEKTLRIRLRGEDGRTVFDRIVKLEEKPLLHVLGRLNYYMNEPAARYRVETLAPENENLSGRLEIAGQTVEVKASRRFYIEFPLSKIADGHHEGTLTLLDSGNPVVSVPVTLMKRPYREHATQINHFSRSLLVEGKPYFPFSPFKVTYNGDRAKPEEIRAYVDFYHRNGFRTLDTLTWGMGDDYSGIRALLDRAVEKGMKVMMWQAYMDKNGQLGEEAINKILKASDSPCIITERIMDEPEIGGISSETAEKHLVSMREKFPYRPSYMNNTFLGIPNNYANLNTDILMVDDYLTNRARSVKSVMDNVDIMWTKGAPAGKPCFFFLVGNNIPNHYREISGPEQIAQTYGAIASGCTGLSYFYGTPAALGHWNAYVQLNKEILSLTDVICSEEDVVSAFSDGEPGLLRLRTRRHQGYLYVISVNVDDSPAGKVTFTLPAEYQYEDPVEVLFENRKLERKDGAFQDEFSGHTRHVYKIKLRNE